MYAFRWPSFSGCGVTQSSRIISCDTGDLTAKGRREFADRDDLGDLLEGFGIRLLPLGGREG
jgi:hypothetical protein